jgi:hypothetical protein
MTFELDGGQIVEAPMRALPVSEDLDVVEMAMETRAKGEYRRPDQLSGLNMHTAGQAPVTAT